MATHTSALDSGMIAKKQYDDNNGAMKIECYSSAAWTTINYPSTATAATTSKAGVSGQQHVCNSITASISTGATAQTPVQVVLRDGATGVGAILWTATLACPANSCSGLSVTGLSIVGTAGNAMTLEFSGAGVTASQQAVTLGGFDVQ